jgi:hypothetical protein
MTVEPKQLCCVREHFAIWDDAEQRKKGRSRNKSMLLGERQICGGAKKRRAN